MFLAVAEERSFTRAATRIRTSQSAISQIIRRLEAETSVKLLIRTTRSVAPTAAGQQLVDTLRPAFDDINTRLTALRALRERPSGLVRLTSGPHAAETLLWPVVSTLLGNYPEVSVELSIDGALADIVSDRFDVGVRLGEQAAKDMIAVRIGPDLRRAVVCSPDYLERHAAPRTSHDLTTHRCINIRLADQGRAVRAGIRA